MRKKDLVIEREIRNEDEDREVSRELMSGIWSGQH